MITDTVASIAPGIATAHCEVCGSKLFAFGAGADNVATRAGIVHELVCPGPITAAPREDVKSELLAAFEAIRAGVKVGRQRIREAIS